MTATQQLTMFEPEGKKLAQLVESLNKIFTVELKRSEHLSLCGFTAAAKIHSSLALEAAERASVCEMALQFEILAGLS